MEIRTIDWVNNRIKIIDQTALPAKFRYLYIYDIRSLWQAIRKMRVRGAPALGATGALGVYLAVKNSKAKDFAALKKEIDKAIKYIGSSRPTAINLFWGLKRMRQTALKNRGESLSEIKSILLKEAQAIMEEDRRVNRRMARHGSRLINKGDAILTICNTGVLATIDYGTALGLLYRAKEQSKSIKVYACETRPLLQGARLTTWELKRKGINVTLICDSAAAALMAKGEVDKVIVGADRIARNGDTANKVGTCALAILAKYHGIPFYVVAPSSTIDSRLSSGKGIPIEQRDKSEVTHILLKVPIAPAGVKAYNPAFDVTPHRLISAIVTEKGIIRPPYRKKIGKILRIPIIYEDK